MDDKNNPAEGAVRTTVETAKKIKQVHTIFAIIGPILPAIGIGLLIIICIAVIFLPFISTFNFAGGDFNSSSTYKERAPMTMNLGGFGKEDVKIFQTISDGSKQYKNLSIKKYSSETLDLSLLISTIQAQNVNNFNDDGDVYNIDDAIKQSENEINNFQTIDDFNEYVNKYGNPKTDGTPDLKEYNDQTIVDNSQNKDYYNQMKEMGGSVYSIYPGNRKLLGNMVSNTVSFGATEYKEWPCPTVDEPNRICNNGSEILSTWTDLHDIVSGDRSASAVGTISAISSAISYADGYKYPSNDNKDEAFKYKNIKYDAGNLIAEVLGGEVPSGVDRKEQIFDKFYKGLDYSQSETVTAIIRRLAGDGSGQTVSIPESGKFVVGHYYATASVKKQVDYDAYEKYLESVFLKHVYIDCETCKLKEETDEIKNKKAKAIYEEIWDMKSLFDNMNQNNSTYIGSSFVSSDFGGGGTASIAGVSYQCGAYESGLSSDYAYHRANDLYTTAPGLPNIYPLLEGTVVKVVNNCHSYCPSEDANRYVDYHIPLELLSAPCSCGGGWGNHVQIQSTYNGKPIYAIYAHLSSVNVSVGDKVNYNTVLGVMGTTGVSTGNHLHIELSYTGQSNDKFPPTMIFSKETVLGTLCERKIDNGDENE